MAMDSFASFLTSLREEEAKWGSPGENVPPAAAQGDDWSGATQSKLAHQGDDWSGAIQAELAQPPSPKTDTDAPLQAAEALIQMSRLVEQAPDIRGALITFRSVNQFLLERVQIIGTYKELHDLLHQLEFGCYNLLTQGIRNVAATGEFPEYLPEAELTLQFIIDKAREVTRHPFLSTNEPLIATLMRARELLLGGIDDSDLRRLGQAENLLNRVLSVEPSKVNARIVATAVDLRVLASVKEFERVEEALNRNALGVELVHRFTSVLEGLKTSAARLNDLIWEHDEFQIVDDTLRRIEAEREDGFFELEDELLHIRRSTARLYGNRQSRWGPSLKAAEEKLQESLDRREAHSVRASLLRYRRAVSHSFYQVDLELLEQCRALQRTLEPLQQAVDMLIG